MEAKQPQRLGKYDVVEEIGRGGFATVYRALDTTLEREVALKVLDPLLMRDTAWVERFRREARAVAALDHPHIVTIHEIAEAGGRLFIAMKLIDGPSLAERLKAQGALPWEETLRIVGEVASALDYAHGRGVLHRDLKPGNVLLSERGAVLTDFGFARLVGESSLSVSLSGGVVGTPSYIALELWHNRPAGVPSDLYALGCIVYEMLTGRKAFSGDSPPAVMMAHFQPLALPERWPEGVPQGIEDVLHKALAREPGARYASVGELVAALTDLQADPLAEPYAALQTALQRAQDNALAAERWAEALRLAEDIRAQAPDYRDVAALAQQAQAGLERAQRAGWAAQWREQALAAEQAGRWDAARAAAQRWLEMAPGDGEARALLERVDQVEAEVKVKAEAEERARREAEARARREAEERARREREAARVRAREERGGIPVVVWVAAVVLLVALGAGGAWALVALRATPTPQVVESAETATPKPAMAVATRVLPTATPVPVAGATWVREKDGMTMVYVPAGEFTMGGDEYDDEKPIHTVYLDAFWIDRTEVTNEQYQECVEAGTCRAPTMCDWGEPTYGDAAKAEHPVLCVSWNDATAYCEWAGGRLPTEAEWEKAARGTDGRPYPWGDTFDGSKVNFCDRNCEFDWKDDGADDGYARTAPVGSYPAGASPYGVLDMAGNVWEWVADWYDSGYYGSSPSRNPTGPSSGEQRVVRGGSWYSGPDSLRTADRFRLSPDYTFDNVGFRCARGSP